MRLVMPVLVLASFCAFAGGEFSTGGSEMWAFKGYSFATAYIYGEEDHEPDMAFRAITDLTWVPRVNDFLDAKFELKLYSTDGEVHLEDVYMNLHFSDQVCLRGGQFKRPFGYGYTESGSGLRFLDRPLWTGYSGFGKYGKRDVGFGLYTDFDVAGLDIVYSNGSRDNKPEDDSNKQITFHGWASPTDWVTLGGSYGSYSAYEDSTMESSFSSSGFGGYAALKYPASDNVDIGFFGEYLSLGWWGPEVSGLDTGNAGIYSVELNAMFGVENAWLLTGIQPAVRYEQISPAWQGTEAPDSDNYGAMDFCLNLFMTKYNTVQIGARNYSFEDENTDGYTDMYLNWRMKF
ncbi:hypothetical protein JW921_02330 [Candidatus Fermentibacterales bacterium]|nr:hypothetical protein [Candidatus Fermentibacterales bacterium]